MNYSDLLKDPKWQKRRLEILQRDNFTCKVCDRGLNDGIPLNVHHKRYESGKKPWEYPSSNLITLCEKCHKKIHDGIIAIPVDKSSVKRYSTIFYKSLFAQRGVLSGTDVIVLSNLIKLSLRSNENKCGSNLKIHRIATKEIAEKCLCTPNSIRNSLRNLTCSGHIKDGLIKDFAQITANGYIKIEPIRNAKGWELILYSFLKERSRPYNGTIDTWATRIANLTNTTADNVIAQIHRLKSKGYLERLNDGRLRVI